MNDNNKKYWKGLEELSNDPEFLKKAHDEFPEFLPLKETHGSDQNEAGAGRRDFLKLLGFGLAAVSLAACEAPVKKVIPYVNKPEDVDPGNANWYASSYMHEGEYCSILVKTREGRPIKIEGNPNSSVTKGGTSPRVQASLLSLYDETRLQYFLKGGNEVKVKDISEYASLDNEIKSKLSAIAGKGGAIRIVSNTIISPSTKKVIADFKSKYPTTEHIQYDANSVYGLLLANQKSFGKFAVPSYDFSKANTIVSFGADFLGTWIAPVEFAKQYGVTRKLNKSKKTMSRHYQIESNLSMTGCNADFRLPVKPSEEALLVAELYAAVSGGAAKNEFIKKAADDLLKSKGKSLVVSGSNDVNVQLVVNQINQILGSYGSTIDINTTCNYKQGDDAAMNSFIKGAANGQVAGVIFLNCNPVYDHPLGAELKAGLAKVELRIAISDRKSETAELAEYVCPGYHFLESWDDAEPKKGYFSLVQPTITPIFRGTRAAQESLLAWAGTPQSYYDYLTRNWKGMLGGTDWNQVLHDGVFEPAAKGRSVSSEMTADSTATNSKPAEETSEPTVVHSTNGDVSSQIASINETYKAGNGIEIKLYEKVGVGTGSFANNPWLQEMPDPVSKVTWDNYLSVSKKFADEKGLKQGDYVTVSGNGKKIENVPVLIQPGQNSGSVSLAIGYGREKAGKCGNGVGVNAYPLITVKNDVLVYIGTVTIEKSSGNRVFAQTQTHHTVMARPVIQDAKLSEYQENASAGRYMPMIHTAEGHKKPKDVTLWYEHEKPNQLWGMVIDLNSCIGCNACVIGCQVENNVPVVGRDEVTNRREMHWIRIDRYYSSDAEPKETGKYFESESGVKDMEIASENPQVTFQPMMCQHCNHAPCETVCPVAATTHSSEGLNQMAYNRCIGTRYCANNCPYKVRRFNWFKYFDNSKFPDNTSMNNPLGKMVLNPDVTVRSRGVMEKCSLCVQRIQEGKLAAKREKRRVKDKEINTACAQACPTNAITFGDINDPESLIHQEIFDNNKERNYYVLEEVNTQPNVSYLTKIRNI